MGDEDWVPLRAAWDEALYGAGGFYRSNEPAEHFRTSSQASIALARAVVALARRFGVNEICDVGAGGGELLTAVHGLDPDLSLLGVDLRGRPPCLAPAIDWQRELPAGQRGLVFANELLDNIPCDVVELSRADGYRIVEVDRRTGAERLGQEAAPAQLHWLDVWWPTTAPDHRVEIGASRDALWASVCRANPAATCIAVDYGHLRGDRPDGGSLASYRRGVQTTVTYDGRHDVTAHVAFDSLAAAVGGTPRRQRDLLLELGLTGSRPPLEQATIDPRGYLRDLSVASAVGELTARDGLGGWWWLVTPPGEPAREAPPYPLE